MTISAWTGPIVAFGNETGGAIDYNPEGATSLFFHGTGLLDHRAPYTYTPGQNFGAQTIGWLGANTFKTMYGPPETLSTTLISAAGHTVNGTAVTLASSTVAGLATGVTITRADTGVAVSGLLELDPLAMSATANLASGSNVLTVTATGSGSGNNINGICIGMVLTDSTTAANIPTGTTIIGYGTGAGGIGTYTMSANATATATGDTVTGLFTAFPNAIPFGSAGTIRLYNPCAMISRAVSITSTTGQTAGGVFTVRGFDIYGYAMTEQITLSGASATTTNGKKAFKYILSVTPNFTDSSDTYSVGTQDVVGFPLRTDHYQVGMELDVTIEWNNATVAASTGYTFADRTATQTATTGDVRGTWTLQTAASNGTLILGFSQSPLVPNMGSSTGLFGVAQYADF